MTYRTPARPHGLHRVADDTNCLPQAAQRLDNSSPPWANEIEIDVECLNIDSASFRQIVDDVGDRASGVAERVRGIVDRRGKMENPVTGSGGMLVGEVTDVGPEYTGNVRVGDHIATLVSLTLTPLRIEEVRDVHFHSDQLRIDGTAFLWSEAPVIQMPADLGTETALSIFDVCGAPKQVQRMAQSARTGLVLGVGKSGLLSAVAFRDALGSAGRVFGVDLQEGPMLDLSNAGILDDYRVADGTAPVEVLEAVRQMTDRGAVDAVVNTCNVADTEISPVLSCVDGGEVLYFNMGTSFSKAALGSEGLGKDVQLLIGNGFVPGHADYALELYENYPVLRELWPV